MFSFGLENPMQPSNGPRTAESMSISPHKEPMRASTMTQQATDVVKGGQKRLGREVDKIRSWMVKSEFQLEQKEKVLKEASQTIDQLRKAVIDAQSQNDVINIRYQEEIEKKEDILQKIEATREVCELLKQKVRGYEETIQQYENDKMLVEEDCNKRMELHNDLCEKFDKLNMEMDHDRDIYHQNLASEQERRQAWLDQQNFRLETVREKVVKTVEKCNKDSVFIEEQRGKVDNAYKLLENLREVSQDTKEKYLNLAVEFQKTDDEVQRLEKEKAEMIETMEKMSSEVKCLKENFQKTLEEMQTTSTHYQEKQSTMLAQQGEMQNEIEKYRLDLQAVTENSEELNQKITQCTELIAELEQEKNSLKEDKVQLEAKVEEKINENREQVEGLKTELQTAFDRELNFLAELDFTKQEQQSMYVAKQRSEKRLAEKEAEVAKLSDDICTMNRQIEALHGRYEEDLGKMRSEMEEVVNEKTGLEEDRQREVVEAAARIESLEQLINELTAKIQQQDVELTMRAQSGAEESAMLAQMRDNMNKQEKDFREKLEAQEYCMRDMIAKYDEEIKDLKQKGKTQEKDLKEKYKNLEKETKEKLKNQEKEFKEKMKEKDQEMKEKLKTNEKQIKEKMKQQEESVVKKMKKENEKRLQTELAKKNELEKQAEIAKAKQAELEKQAELAKQAAERAEMERQAAANARAGLVSVPTDSSSYPEPMEMGSQNSETNETEDKAEQLPSEIEVASESVASPSAWSRKSAKSPEKRPQSSKASSPAVSLWSVGGKSPAKPAPRNTSKSKLKLPPKEPEDAPMDDDVSVASSSTDLVCLTMDDVQNKRIPIFTPRMKTPQLGRQPPMTPLARKTNVRPGITPVPATPKTPSVLTSRTPGPLMTPVRRVPRPNTPLDAANNQHEKTPQQKRADVFSTPKTYQKRLTPSPSPGSLKDVPRPPVPQKRAKIAGNESGGGDVQIGNIRTTKKKVQPMKKVPQKPQKQKEDVLGWFDDDL